MNIIVLVAITVLLSLNVTMAAADNASQHTSCSLWSNLITQIDREMGVDGGGGGEERGREIEREREGGREGERERERERE